MNAKHSLSLDTPYFKLANFLDACAEKDQAIELLFNQKYADLIFTKEKPTDFIPRTLYHFCRSRLAYFQQYYSWFQKEAIALIDFWLEEEMLTAHFLNHIPEQTLYEILVMNQHTPPHTKFPFFLFQKPVPGNEILIWLKELKTVKYELLMPT